MQTRVSDVARALGEEDASAMSECSPARPGCLRDFLGQPTCVQTTNGRIPEIVRRMSSRDPDYSPTGRDLPGVTVIGKFASDAALTRESFSRRVGVRSAWASTLPVLAHRLRATEVDTGRAGRGGAFDQACSQADARHEFTAAVHALRF